MKAIKAFRTFLKYNKPIILSLIATIVIIGVFAYISFIRNSLFWITFGMGLSLIIVIVRLIAYKKDNQLDENKKMIKELERKVKDLENENTIILSTSLNVQVLKETLDIALFDAETTVYRLLDEEVDTPKGKKIRFLGALRMDISAKYGINFKEIILTVDNKKNLYLENVAPRFIGFTNRKVSWEISESLEQKKEILPKFGKSFWSTAHSHDKAFAQRQEEFRKELEKDIENHGPKELNFLQPVMKEKVFKVLKVVLKQYGFELMSGKPASGMQVPLETFLETPKKYLQK